MFHTWRTRLAQVVNAVKMVALTFTAVLFFFLLMFL